MLGGNKRKAAPPLKKVVPQEEEVVLDLPRPLFRGFIGGDAFITKKGYRGLKLESLWVQNIFEAFKTDDGELAAIALQSSLADVNDRVIGGVFGSPFSIGDHGFYAKQQLEKQLVHLQARIKEVCDRNNHYLTTIEWERIEKKLVNISNHSDAAFASTTVGDSFAALAIRQSAFQVAKVCMNAGIDPLVENVEGKDMFDVMKEQYHFLGLQLRDIQDLKVEATKKVLVPTAVENILAEEAKLIDNFHFLSEFADDLKGNMEARAKDIERDKILQRRAFLREEAFSEQKLWNIEQQGKVERYLTEITDLKHYIVEKIHYHESHAGKFESLSKLLLANYTLIDAQSDADSVTGTQSLESSTYTSVSGSVSKSMSTRLRQSAKQSAKGTKSDNASLDKSLSVLSLGGDDSSSAVSGAIQAGLLYVDDESVLTEEGSPNRIPKLPNIPNRLRNARIDGTANKQMKSRFLKSSKGAPTLTSAQTPARPSSAEKGGGSLPQSPTQSPAQSPVQTPAYAPGIAEQSLVPRSAASSPSRGPTSPPAPLGRFSGTNTAASEGFSMRGTAASTRVDSSAQSKRSAAGFSTGTTPSSGNGGLAEARVGTGSSYGDFSPRVGTAPSTPGERMRQQMSQQGPSSLATKEDLYALLGVADEDNASVSSHGNNSLSGAGYGGAGGNSGIPVSSAKILAKSMKDQYAPVLGTLKETENAVIMYR